MPSLLLDTPRPAVVAGWRPAVVPRCPCGGIADSSSVVMVSAASAWEITTKHRLGKLARATEVARDVAGCVTGQRFQELAITLPDAERAGRLPGPHRDPFDRMLIAQALRLDLELVSNEGVFDDYGVRRLW